jgi:arabinoxylan arabinofuranohydrolase
VASAGQGGSIELRLDAKDGMLVGTCDVTSTGDWQEWADTSCAVSGATGEHDLFLVFTGGDSFLFNVDYWQFTATGGAGTGGAAGTGGSSNTGGAIGSGGTNTGGTPAVGGSSSGGAPGSGGVVGVGGSGTGAAAPNEVPPGAGGTDGNEPEETAGCGCQSVTSAPAGAAWALAGLFASLLCLRRRLRAEAP